MSLAELEFLLAVAATTLLRRRISFFSGWDLVFVGEGFVPHRFSAGDGGSVASGVRLRSVLVGLFAKGSDLLCSPVSVFRVGGPFTGVGVVAGLELPFVGVLALAGLFFYCRRDRRGSFSGSNPSWLEFQGGGFCSFIDVRGLPAVEKEPWDLHSNGLFSRPDRSRGGRRTGLLGSFL